MLVFKKKKKCANYKKLYIVDALTSPHLTYLRSDYYYYYYYADDVPTSGHEEVEINYSLKIRLVRINYKLNLSKETTC